MKEIVAASICVLFCSGAAAGFGMDVTPAGAATAKPGTILEKAAVEIRREALLPPNGPAGQPLPLVSHWNMGSQGRGWTPQYQVDVPEKYRNFQRWFLLDTSLDQPRPWAQHANIPVFSLALVRGDKGTLRWLVYAHSPLEDRRGVKLTVPEFGKITIDVPQAGSFYIVDEKDGKKLRIKNSEF